MLLKLAEKAVYASVRKKKKEPNQDNSLQFSRTDACFWKLLHFSVMQLKLELSV